MKNNKQNDNKFLEMVKAFKNYYLSFLVALGLLIISIVLTILVPGGVRDLTNVISPASQNFNGDVFLVDFNAVVSLAGKVVIFIAIAFITSLLANLIFNVIIQKFTMDLRTKISQKINKLPLSYFDTKFIGDILSVVTNDIDTLGQSLQNCVNLLINSGVMLIGVIIAMFISCYQLAIVTLISIPVVVVVIFIVFKIALPLFKKNQQTIAKINSLVEEDFSGQLVVKAFNAEDKKKEDFNKVNKELGKSLFSSHAIGNFVEPFMSLISYVTYAAILVVGGLLFKDGIIADMGVLTGFIIYVVLFQQPLFQIGEVASVLQQGTAACNRVFTFLDEEEIVNDDAMLPCLDPSNIRGKVEFKDVCFGYDKNKLTIKHFSEKVYPGMKVAIVGPTGAGKTTLVNLLVKFYELTSGQIFVDDVSIADMPRRELRNIFGMIDQVPWVINGSLYENIVYNLKDVDEDRLNQVLRETHLMRFINSLPDGIDTVIQKDNALSAGQKQLITIARAMLENAPMLILDEATSNVDTRTELLIQHAMDKLTSGRTCFVIAHRLSTIKNADLIIVMKDGNVVETGTHSTLLAKGGLYSELYNAQFS